MPLPSDYGTCRITGTWVNLDSSPASGTVTFTPQVKTSILAPEADTIIVPTTVTVALDANGQIDLYIPATNDEDVWPQEFVYRVHEKIPTGNRKYYLDAPVDEELDLSSIIPESVEFNPNCHAGALVVSRHHPHLLGRDLPAQHPASAIDYNGNALDTFLDNYGVSIIEIDGGYASSEYGS